ncbi:hypothetical protein [Alicyclobacillus hesperidum]|uniref:hypothetical protein n=1 Tax=Alicyclobacillus hesperidum TaxID=89784 RepID=UPI00058D72D9|nr:hypothetical protein [Alicyclobacillus hesperidum]
MRPITLRQLRVAVLIGLASCAIPAITVEAATTNSTDLQQSITQLANEIDTLSAIANSSTGSSLAGSVLAVLRSPSMDWNEVLFGTDALTPGEQQTSAALSVDVTQLLTLQSSDAQALIHSVIQNMESLNNTIQPSDVVTFLQNIVNHAYSEMSALKALQPLNETTAAQQLHTAFDGYLASATPAIQSLFGLGGSVVAQGGGVSTVGVSDAGAPSLPTPPQNTGGAFTTVLQTATVNSAAASVTQSVNGASFVFTVPAHAFATTETLTLTGGKASDAAGVLTAMYAGFEPLYTFGVFFSGDAPMVPIPVQVDAQSLPANVQVFSVAADGTLTAIPATVAGGSITFSLQGDTDVVIAAPNSTSVQPIVVPSKPVPSWSGYVTEAIQVNGKTQSEVPGIVSGGTTYMPIWYVMKVLDAIGFQNTWNGQGWYLVAPKGSNPDFSHVQVGTGKGIYLNGKLIERVPIKVATDPTSHTKTTYMPIWYVMQALHRVNVTSSWAHSVWNIQTTGIVNASST